LMKIMESLQQNLKNFIKMDVYIRWANAGWVRLTVSNWSAWPLTIHIGHLVEKCRWSSFQMAISDSFWEVSWIIRTHLKHKGRQRSRLESTRSSCSSNIVDNKRASPTHLLLRHEGSGFRQWRGE
jgi:hypothetical protein